MADTKTRACVGCGASCIPIRIRPYRLDDGLPRCAECRSKRKAEIIAEAKVWKEPRCSPYMNRGGMSLIEHEEAA